MAYNHILHDICISLQQIAMFTAILDNIIAFTVRRDCSF